MLLDLMRTLSPVLQKLQQRQAKQLAEQDLSVPAIASFQKHYASNWLKSDFLLSCQQRYPDAIQTLFKLGWIDQTMQEKDFQDLLLAQRQSVQTPQALYSALRAFRQQHMYRIAWRNLAGMADIWQCMAEISALADVILQTTLAQLLKQHGLKASDFFVIAMGKLGARELNFSSDVDLIFAYAGSDQNESAWLDVARDFIDVLHRVTEDGFVYRVDMRLRPFGSTGPLVMHQQALLDYYQKQGRDWERYAMIKARVLTGSQKARSTLQQALQTFAFRPYVDYGMQQAIRAMKAMIDREVKRKNVLDDIKLGKGGIREIEFIIQAKQLIYAAHYPQLHCASIKQATMSLVACDILTREQGDTLIQDYALLRQVEHDLQMLRDTQTHTLPTNALDQARLALALGEKDWTAARASIDRVLKRVSKAFDHLLNVDIGRLDLQKQVTRPRGQAFLARQRWRKQQVQSMPLSSTSADFEESLGRKTLSAIARARLQQALPLLEQAAQQCAQPEKALTQAHTLLRTLATRSTYLMLLIENQHVLPTLLGFMVDSTWMQKLIVQYPGLLSTVMQNDRWPMPMSQASLIEHIKQRTKGIDALDTEARMDMLRQCKHGQGLLIAAAELTGKLPLMKVSDALTYVAEVMIEEVTQRAWDYLVEKGLIDQSIPRLKGFVIVAYGKLAGLELSYNSDVDLIFLYDNQASQLDHKTYVRLGQRILNQLQTQTYFGALYEVDLRLRPSGQSGLLVSRIEAFAKYQMDSAWTWEHQALVRSRPIVGDKALFSAFNVIRKQALCQPRDAKKLAQDVADMQAKIQKNIAIKTEVDRIKYGQGGLVEIEFFVQQMALQYAHQFPQIIIWSDDVRLLEAFVEAGLITLEQQQYYMRAYLDLRAKEHRLVLS